jgi:signal transduction histidine kinase
MVCAVLFFLYSIAVFTHHCCIPECRDPLNQVTLGLSELRQCTVALTKLHDSLDFSLVDGYDVEASFKGVPAESVSKHLQDLNETIKDVVNVLGECEYGTESTQRIIQDMLDSTRVMKGTFTLVVQEFQIKQLVESAASAHRRTASQKKQTVTVQYETTCGDLVVEGDFHRLLRAINTYCSNATKFANENTTVTISAMVLDRVSSISGSRWVREVTGGRYRIMVQE